jgi:hypothetical protein
MVLRRYLTFYKLNDLFEKQSLYFSPASKFIDKLEGDHTNINYKAWDNELLQWGFTDQSRIGAREAKQNIINFNQQMVVISCWTCGVEEDLKMWAEYGCKKDSVIIETSVGQLRSELGSNFLVVPVRYIDFQKEFINGKKKFG